jgi:hypothetical protein
MHMWNSFVRKQRLVLSTNSHKFDYHNRQVWLILLLLFIVSLCR